MLEGPQLASVSSALQPSCNHQPSQFPIYTTQIHYVGCASASSTVHAVRCRNLHKGRCSTLLISLESSIMLCWISGTRIKFCIPFITSVLFSIAPAIFMVAMTEREQFHHGLLGTSSDSIHHPIIMHILMYAIPESKSDHKYGNTLSRFFLA